MNSRSFFPEGLIIAALITQSGYRLMSAKDIRTAARKAKKSSDKISRPDVWLRITPDNQITVYIGKSEMGQGVFTSLPMILADELEADWRQVRVEMSPEGKEYRDPVWGAQTTGGSTSVRHMFEPLRQAGAAAREMLIRAASGVWGVPTGECEALKGRVRNKKSGERLSYGELSLKAAQLPIPGNSTLKEESSFGLIGSPLELLDIPYKVSGSAIFGTDIFVPDMLYAAISRPPVYGANIISYDKEAVLKIPVARRILKVTSGIGICADTPDAAWKGRDALNIKWDVGTHPDLNNEKLENMFINHLHKTGRTARNQGDALQALRQASEKVEAVYSVPYLAHVPIEPMNCTASVSKDRCDIWASTQSQTDVIQAAVKATGLRPEQVFVHTTYLGGGFGRRLEADYAEQAVELSNAAGRPIKLIWTREEDFKYDFYRPGCCCKMAGGIDAKGRFTSWSQKVVAPSIYERAYPEGIENGVDPSAVEGLADMDYEVPHILTKYVRIDTPIPVGFWRSVGHSQNAFFVESFVDEMAHAVGEDSLEFRLHLLKNHLRVARVLEVAAEQAGWGKALPEGMGRGIAQHFSYGSYVAQVAEVSLDEKTGIVKVHRVVCAVDCGTVINPATVVSQIEGGILFGLSAALKEGVLFENGGVRSANFNDYGILRMKEAPEIEVHIVKSDEKVGGIGEVGVPPIAPAVANGLFHASGLRLRRLPLKPETVKEALKSSVSG